MNLEATRHSHSPLVTLLIINSVTKRGSHGALRSQLSTLFVNLEAARPLSLVTPFTQAAVPFRCFYFLLSNLSFARAFPPVSSLVTRLPRRSRAKAGHSSLGSPKRIARLYSHRAARRRGDYCVPARACCASYHEQKKR